MNKEKVKELLKRRSTRIGGIVLAAAIVFSGSMWAWKDSQSNVPELVTFVDQAEDMVIDQEEPPLGAPKVTKSTKTQTKKKKIKLKKASKKTYVQKGKSSTKKTKKVSKQGTTTTTTETVKATDVKTQFKKGSKVKTQVTTIKTTVTKTVQTQGAVNTAATMTTAAASASNGPVNISTVAPKVDSRVMNAFNKLGFTINVNSGVNYSGLFDARSRSITLKSGDATVYHELGHFLGFIAGNYDKTAEFQGIFNREKVNYTAYNKAYVLSNSSEYFAESFKNYTTDPAALRSSRPETYSAIEKALSMVTDTQLNNILSVYKVIWK